MEQPVAAAVPVYLVPVAGPTLEPLALKPSADAQSRSKQGETLTLGRQEGCDLLLPASAESVSRVHCRFRFDVDANRWRAVDANSRWGTFLNGVRMKTDAEYPLAEGDLLRIHPWTFYVGAAPRRRGLMGSDDAGASIVRTLDGGGASRLSRLGPGMQEDLLALLLETAAAIHDAPDELTLAQRLIDAAVRGSGLPNAAVLRPVNTAGHVEVVASRGAGTADAEFTFSRSLVSAAAEGHVAELTGASGAAVSSSIVQMNISAALCVPLMLGPAPAAFLYLDARGSGKSAARPNAAAFCAALCRLAGLALANLKRVDVERRQAALERDLSAAAAAQRWVLPRRVTAAGPFVITGESRPGRYVGGDFFDVIELAPGRVAVALGDVSGKGVEASVLMTASQGFLHAALMDRGGDPAEAVTALNRFLAPRRPDNRFVTLWVGVLDAQQRMLTCVDAGHGYAALVAADGTCQELGGEGGPPLGLLEDYTFTARAVALPVDGRVVIVSDGIVEQPAAGTDMSGKRRQFEMSGVLQCLCGRPGAADDVADLFAAVVAHAGTEHLADDATAVCVGWAFAGAS